MKRRNDLHAEMADRIARSEDPRAALLQVARVASELDRQRRRRLILPAASAAVVLISIGAWWMGRGHDDQAGETQATAAEDQVGESPSEDALEAELNWLGSVRDRPKTETLTRLEVKRVLGALSHPLPEARRRALRIAASRSLPVQDDQLAWFLANTDASDDSLALRLAWRAATRSGNFASPELLEPFAIAGTAAARKYALRALGAIDAYRPTAAVVASLEGAPQPILDAAQQVLRKAGQ